MNFRQLMTRTDKEVAAFNSRLGKYFALAVKKDGRVLNDTSLGLTSQVGGLMVQAMYLSMGMRHDYRPALKGLGVPVLVIHGDRDMIPAATGKAFASYFDKARFRVIAGAGHFVFDDQPKKFAAVVKEFLVSVK